MKNLVAINISSNSYIEVIKYNIANNQIEDYLKEDIQYDSSVRKIANYEDLKIAIKTIFGQMGLNGRQNVVITLPTIFLNHSELPISLDNESLITALSSEAENNYLFSNSDPKVSYQLISEDEEEGTQNVVYTAYHKDEINQIQSIFSELGHNIIAIDNSYASFVRTIINTGKVNAEIQSFSNWVLVSVRGNSFVMLSFTGDRLLDITEKPLATRSATADELYHSITTALNDLIDEQMPDKVLITSKFDEISAEIIASKSNTSCQLDFIEFNKFAQISFVNTSHNVPPSIAPLITPEVYGAANITISKFPLKFDYLSGVMTEGEIKKQSGPSISISNLKTILIPVGIVILVINIITFATMSFLTQNIKKELGSLKSTKKTLERQIKSTVVIEEPEDNQNDEILLEMENNNKDLVKSFNSLSINIPEKLWLTSVLIKHNLRGYIEGKSFKMEDVANYYKDLKSISKLNQLRISKLKVDGEEKISSSSNSFNTSKVNIRVKNSTLPNLPTDTTKKTQKSYYFKFKS